MNITSIAFVVYRTTEDDIEFLGAYGARYLANAVARRANKSHLPTPRARDPWQVTEIAQYGDVADGAAWVLYKIPEHGRPVAIPAELHGTERAAAAEATERCEESFTEALEDGGMDTDWGYEPIFYNQVVPDIALDAR